MNQAKKNLGINFLLCIAIISTSLFMFEVMLSRLFSVILSYHYAFLVASVAILGMGLGSMLEYRDVSEYDDQSNDKIGLYLKGLIITMIAVFSIIYFVPYYSPYIYIAVSILPYLIAGRLMAVIFTAYGKYSDKVYFADLLGAGIAAMASILLFFAIGFLPGVFILFALMFLGLLLWYRQSKKNIDRIVGLMGILVFIIGMVVPGFREHVESNFTAYLSSPSTSLERLRDGNLTYQILDTKWDGFARTDVIELKEDETRRIVSTDGGANSYMMQWDGIAEKVPTVTDSVDFMPYVLEEPDQVAIIGAGGGRDVLQAILGKAKNIDAIEINQSSNAIVKEMGEYNGHIYDLPQVNVITGDGRSAIAKMDKKYDVIFLSLVMTNTSEAGYAMAESYIYTKEAIETYYRHLKANGKLVFVAHDTADTYKIVNTGFEVLLEEGILLEKIKDHFIVGLKVMEHGEQQMLHTPTVMIQKSPYTEKEIERVHTFFDKHPFTFFHLPNHHENNFLSQLSMGLVTMDQVIDQAPINIKIATDEKPFFYQQDKGLPKTLILLISLVLVFIFLFFGKPIITNKAYFSGIHFSVMGIAFMLVEVAMIQKMTLFLEHPTTAFVVSIAALLIGGGIGSYFSNKFSLAKDYHLGPLGAAVSIGLAAIGLHYGIQSFSLYSFSIKILIAMVILLSNGFFMGMIFPTSIKRMNESQQSYLIPVLYGINGGFSVFGSVLAIIVSMKLGISISLMIGAGLYGILFLIMPKLSLKEN